MYFKDVLFACNFTEQEKKNMEIIGRYATPCNPHSLS